MTALDNQSTRDQSVRTERHRPANRGLIVAVAVLVVAAFALGLWLVRDSSTGTSTSGAQQVIEVYNEAWARNDRDALLAVVTDDFLEEYRRYAPGDQVIAGTASFGAFEAARNAQYYDYVIEVTGDAIVVGDGPWFVSVAEAQYGEGDFYDGIATYVVVDEDGTLKLASKSWSGLRQPDDE